MAVINKETLNIYICKLNKLISDLHFEKINQRNKYNNEELKELDRLINNLERFRVIHTKKAIVALSLLHECEDRSIKEQSESIIKELIQETLELKESIAEIQKKLALRKDNEFLFSMITGITTVIVAPILFITMALLLGPVASLPLTMIMVLLAPAPIPLAIPFMCVVLPFGLSYTITSIFLDEPYDPATEEVLIEHKKRLDSKSEILELLEKTSINSLSENVTTSIHGFFNHKESGNPTNHKEAHSTQADTVDNLSAQCFAS